MMKRILAALLAATVFAGQARAGSSTITVKDSTGATQTFVVTTDGSGNFLGRQVICDATAGASCATVSGGAVKVDGSAAIQPVSGTVTANAGTNLNTSLLALEAGGNLASVATSTGRIPAQGQALAGASLPVVLTAAQVTTLTPLATVAVTQSTAANLNATVVGTGTFVTQATLAAETTKVIGTVNVAAGQTIATTNAGTFATQAAQSGTWNLTNISGTVSLPTGASSAANQTAIQAPVAAATATATKSVLLGGQFDTTQKTLTNGQQAALSASARGAMFVAVGADGFAVTNAGTFATQSAVTAASGAYASGSLAAGAVVDIGNLSTPITPATATATKGVLLAGQYNSTQATFTNGQQGSVQLSSRGELKSLLMDAAGNARGANVDSSGNLSVAINGGTLVNGNGRAVPGSSSPVVQPSSSTTGNIVANNTTAVVVNAAATVLQGIQVYGLGSAPAYLKLYNATSATCGSGTPVKRIMIPAASTAANGAGSNVPIAAGGVAFGTGLTYCVTTGIADNDTTAPAASTFLVNLDWSA